MRSRPSLEAAKASALAAPPPLRKSAYQVLPPTSFLISNPTFKRIVYYPPVCIIAVVSNPTHKRIVYPPPVCIIANQDPPSELPSHDDSFNAPYLFRRVHQYVHVRDGALLVRHGHGTTAEVVIIPYRPLDEFINSLEVCSGSVRQRNGCERSTLQLGVAALCDVLPEKWCTAARLSSPL